MGLGHARGQNCSCTCSSSSSEAKASRVIICKFPVKLPFPVYSGLQRASTSRHIHSDGVLAGRPAFHHVRMCQYVFALYIVFGLRSVMTTALHSDESLSTSDLDIIQSAAAYGRTNYLKRRRQREKALRSGESADKRLERLQRRRQRECQLRTVESPDDRLERLQRKAQHERQLRTIESANDRLERMQRKAQHERQVRTIESANDRLERLQREAERKRQLRTVASADKKLEQLQRRRQRRCQLGTVRSPSDRLQCLQRKRQPKGQVTTDERLPLLQRRRQIWHRYQQKTTDNLRQKGKHVKSTRTDHEVHQVRTFVTKYVALPLINCTMCLPDLSFLKQLFLCCRSRKTYL